MTISIADVVREGAEILQSSGLGQTRREAGDLLQHVLGRDRTFILAHPEQLVTNEQLQSFRNLLLRRASGEPLQYVIGHQPFFGLDFEVAKGVLIPRPETELLVETALSFLKDIPTSPSICDVGTGSGCIAITLLHGCPTARAVAIDISPAALEIANRNARRHDVAERLTFVEGDCFSSLSAGKDSFDLIVSNPPYVSETELSGLQREVRDHEPREALAGGPDGLDIVRRLLTESGAFLKTGGHLLIEIGFSQGEAVKALVDERIWQLHGIHSDLQGIPRVVILKKIS